MSWQHDALANDLAEHLLDNRKRMVWTNLQLGPHGSARPDVFTIDKSFAHPNPRAYEIKISVSDFRSDVTSGKWQSYLGYAQAVTFAVPHGLIAKAEVPQGCGLMVRSERGWSTQRRPTLGVLQQIPEEALLKLLIDGSDREFRAYRTQQASDFAVRRQACSTVAAEVAEFLLDRERATARSQSLQESARRQLEEAKESVRREVAHANEHAEAVLKEVRAAFGIEQEKEGWSLRIALRQRLARIDRDGEVAHLRAALRKAKASLEEAERIWPETEPAAEQGSAATR